MLFCFSSRSCSPSPKPPTVFKSSHRKALSAVEAYTKLLQEQSMTCFKDSPQTEKSPEKQQDLSPQVCYLLFDCGGNTYILAGILQNKCKSPLVIIIRQSNLYYPKTNVGFFLLRYCNTQTPTNTVFQWADHCEVIICDITHFITTLQFMNVYY